MKTKCSAKRAIVCLLTISIFSVTDILAQANQVPADTGLIKWGHTEFGNYTYPAMCDRAGIELHRYQNRFAKIDTTFEEVLDSTIDQKWISENARKLVKACISQFSPDKVPEQQLWGYLRSALLIGDDQRAMLAAERAVLFPKDSAMRDRAYSLAISSFLNSIPSRIDLAHIYIRRLDSLYPTPSATAAHARLNILTYWNRQYYKDSIRKYADEAISLIHKLPSESQDLIDVLSPFQALINIANNDGDIAAQEKYLDSMTKYFSDWRGGTGAYIAANTQKTIAHRRSIYNKKALPVKDGMWFNTNGNQWPVLGKISLIVLVDPACGMVCWEQYRTIKAIKTVFGEEVHITLAAQSAGFVIGSYVLDEQAEGDSIVNFFSKIYDMNYTVLLDPRPKSKIPDGRIIRGIGPVAEHFNEWNEITAILAGKDGRIQWTGTLSDNSSKRPVFATITRLLKNK